MKNKIIDLISTAVNLDKETARTLTKGHISFRLRLLI